VPGPVSGGAALAGRPLRPQAEEALPIIRQVVAAQEANPALGPDHPDTLSSRYLLAALLHNVNGSDQA
jgi:hypothetical protein